MWLQLVFYWLWFYMSLLVLVGFFFAGFLRCSMLKKNFGRDFFGPFLVGAFRSGCTVWYCYLLLFLGMTQLFMVPCLRVCALCDRRKWKQWHLEQRRSMPSMSGPYGIWPFFVSLFFWGGELSKPFCCKFCWDFCLPFRKFLSRPKWIPRRRRLPICKAYVRGPLIAKASL